jgi:non-ribosomal peptide synthetase component F
MGLPLQICGIYLMTQLSCFQLDFRLARQLTDENHSSPFLSDPLTIELPGLVLNRRVSSSNIPAMSFRPIGQNMPQLVAQAMAQPMPYLNQMVNSFNANIPRANPTLRNIMNQRPQNHPAHRQMNNRNQVPFMQLPHRTN